MLTIEQIRQAVRLIKQKAWDSEVAHSLEDALYIQVLEAVSSGQCEDPEACARAALQTRKINFSRWTA